MKHFHREVMGRAVSEGSLHGRMSLLCGPRQIGKTTAVSGFLADSGFGSLYYNWDTPSVKKRFAVGTGDLCTRWKENYISLIL